MSLTHVILAWIQLFLLGLPMAETPVHDFHYSRSEVNWNETAHTWQVVVRVFTDDLESALDKISPDTSPLNLGDKKERNDANTLIAVYFNAAFQGNAIGTTENDLQWSWVGKEVDFDLTYLYFESQPLPDHHLISLTSTLFHELFEDQVNEVAFQAKEKSLREWLTLEAPQTAFSF
jgi:hypothetical protein